MKNQLLFITCLILLSSCTGPELELAGLIDRAEWACECENLTGDDCSYIGVKFVVREGKIEGVHPPDNWGADLEDLLDDEWHGGPCYNAYNCFKKHLEGRSVAEKSGTYEENIAIRDSR